MAKLSSTDLMDAFREMTLLELSEFVKDFEDTFGVSATVSANGLPPVNPVHDIVPEDEEPDEFDVILEAAGDKKIQVIKEVRVLTELGLKEAKDFVESLPRTVLENADPVAAANAASRLRAAGATVVLR